MHKRLVEEMGDFLSSDCLLTCCTFSVISLSQSCFVHFAHVSVLCGTQSKGRSNVWIFSVFPIMLYTLGSSAKYLWHEWNNAMNGCRTRGWGSIIPLHRWTELFTLTATKLLGGLDSKNIGPESLKAILTPIVPKCRVIRREENLVLLLCF